MDLCKYFQRASISYFHSFCCFQHSWIILSFYIVRDLSPKQKGKFMIYSIYFSPTGGTKQVAEAIAAGMGDVQSIDLIKSPRKFAGVSFTADDLILMSVPSYGGRVPNVVIEAIKAVRGNGAKAILVAVYGNRAIDDTLTELQDALEEADFRPIAGVEAVAEHSLMHQFAAGRPDEEDQAELKGFAARLLSKAASDDTALTLPGSHTYRAYNGVPLKPAANRRCVQCGLCAKECPAGAIPKENPRVTDKNKCISCMHCVSICPKQARHYSKLLSMIAAQKMKKSCSSRKENRLYL